LGPIYGEPFTEKLIELHLARDYEFATVTDYDYIPEIQLERMAAHFVKASIQLRRYYPYESGKDDKLLAYYDDVAPVLGVFPHHEKSLIRLAETRRCIIAEDQEVAVSRWLMRNISSVDLNGSDPKYIIRSMIEPCSSFWHSQYNSILGHSLADIQNAVMHCFNLSNPDQIVKLERLQ